MGMKKNVWNRILVWLTVICLLGGPVASNAYASETETKTEAVETGEDLQNAPSESQTAESSSEDTDSLEVSTAENSIDDSDSHDTLASDTDTDLSDNDSDNISVSEQEIVVQASEEASLAAVSDVITGSFDAVDGKDIATIRYYTDEAKTAYEFAEFSYNSATEQYEYSFPCPYDGFEAVQESENVRETYEGEATVIAEYFSTEKWDGAIDVSWYDEVSSDFYIDTPAKLAGVAAIVNGTYDCETRDYHIKGNTEDFIKADLESDTALIGGATGVSLIGLKEHDFSNRTVHITADLDMGGVDGSEIDHDANASENVYNYPNWLPIGCEVTADPGDISTMVKSAFNGVLDGGGHHITNLYCYRYTYAGWQYSQGTGLVGCLGILYEDEESPSLSPAVRNLSLSGYVYGRRMVGGIVGVTGGGSNAVAGDSVNETLLENLANHAWVYSTDSKGVGGIVASAYVDSGSIINCYNDGQIFTTYAAPAGGIVGANDHMDIFCCYNRGTINTGTYHYGRGIGGTGNSPGNFTVDSCYYLKGSGDDTNYPGYYTYNLPASVSINVTEMTNANMKNGTLLSALNVNGTAYVTGDEGYPVLYWEKNTGEGTLTVFNPEGGTVTASASGILANGTVVYLSSQQETGWNFRYFTLNQNQITGDYVTVNGDTQVSVYLESSKAGVLRILPNAACDISVIKNGMILVDGELQEVTGYPVEAGDSLYEGDKLMITASLKDGVEPDDPNMDYRAAVGSANPYTYQFTYSGDGTEESNSPVFTVDERINADEVSLTLNVVPETTPKLWKNISDTSWYDGEKSSYTLTTPAQLAGLDTLVEDGTDFSGITIQLGNDISLLNTDGTEGSRGWDGIGNADKAFAGTFDGKGYRITDYNGVGFGLFARIKGQSTSSRAQIKNVSVYGTGTGQYASGITGMAMYASISNCGSYVVLDEGSSYIGGIVGIEQGGSSIESCFNYGSITGTGRIGGIAGEISATGSLTDCINKGQVTATSTSLNHVGGVAGNTIGALTRCANYGDVTGSARNIGGLTGQSTSSTAKFTDCYNVGRITYQNGINTLDGAGGLIGYGSIYQIINCHQYGEVKKDETSTSDHVGSVIGRHLTNSKSVISQVYVLDSANEDGYVIDGQTFEALTTASETSATFYASLFEADQSAFAQADGVLAGINGNESFVLTNQTYPELNTVEDLHVHAGGTATCVSQAVCEECGLYYGSLDPTNHEEAEVRNAKDAVWIYDGYTGDVYCVGCETLLETGEVIPADKSREAVTFTVIASDGEEQVKTYTAEQFDTLKTTDYPIGYMFGFKTSTIMAATEYVTLEDVMEDLGVSYEELDQIKVICSGSTSVISGDDLRACKWYYDADGNQFEAPAAFAMTYSSLTGTLDEVAAVAQSSDDLRFGYGISEKQYEDKEEMGGRRMVSPVLNVELSMEQPVSVSAVSDFVIGGRAGTALRLNWAKSSGASGYIIEQYQSEKWTRIKKITNADTLTYRVENLSPGTSYLFRIRAYAMDGTTPVYSDYSSISGKTNPSAVTGLEIGGRAGTALRLNWTKSYSASGYIIEQYSDGEWTRIARIANADTVTYRVEKLSPGITYQFRICSFGFEGKKPLYSGYKSISGTTNPSAVTNLKIGGIARSALRLNWTKATGASGYIVEKYDEETGKWIRVARIADPEAHTYRVEQLNAGTTYQFRVKSYGFDGKTALYSGYMYVSGTTNK